MDLGGHGDDVYHVTVRLPGLCLLCSGQGRALFVVYATDYPEGRLWLKEAECSQCGGFGTVVLTEMMRHHLRRRGLNI